VLPACFPSCHALASLPFPPQGAPGLCCDHGADWCNSSGSLAIPTRVVVQQRQASAAWAPRGLALGAAVPASSAGDGVLPCGQLSPGSCPPLMNTHVLCYTLYDTHACARTQHTHAHARTCMHTFAHVRTPTLAYTSTVMRVCVRGNPAADRRA